MQRALCIWLPEWPIQRLVAVRPELKSRPLVLHGRDPRRGQLVVACCPRAAQQGVLPGMPLAEAATLTKTSTPIATPVKTTIPTQTAPSAKQASSSKALATSQNQASHFEEHQPDFDQQTLSQLASWCERFSPIVGVETADQPSSLLLDITGLAPVFGGEPRMVEMIREAFQLRGYEVRVGTGNTVGAAWAMAHYRGPTQHHQDLLGLPVEALRLQAQTLELLHQLGITTITQLLQLPRQAVATRLGEDPIRRLDQLLGTQPEVIIAHHAVPVFEVEWRLEHPTVRRDTIEMILGKLAELLCAQLTKQDHVVVQAEAILHSSQESRQLTINLFEPTRNPSHLLDLLKLQSERIHLRQLLHRIQLCATATVRLHGGQQLLWDDIDAYTGRAQQREIGALVDRLSSRLGQESVFGVCAQAGALPEKAYRRKPLSNSLRQRSRPVPMTFKAPHRPLWLHDPPLPLQVTTANGRDSRYQPPAHFQFEQQSHQIARHWGPERIETGWWHGRSVRRDYYRVETVDGSRFWLFRRLEDGAWFLHGSFE